MSCITIALIKTQKPKETLQNDPNKRCYVCYLQCVAVFKSTHFFTQCFTVQTPTLEAVFFLLAIVSTKIMVKIGCLLFVTICKLKNKMILSGENAVFLYIL